MKQTVLVTGGAGYIGSHTCKALHEAGFIPVTYDNLSTGHAYAVKWGPLVLGDITDTEKLSQTIQQYNPILVLHFAADAMIIESQQNPAKYYRNNVYGTLSLLEAMQKNKLDKLIFSSTCATYGNPTMAPITEDHPQAPINVYGRTKLIAEQLMTDFDQAYGLKTIKLRYFNAAGADLDTEIGENHTPETHIIPSVIQTALGLRPEVVIYGTDFATRDGSAIRDYIHVADLARAHVLAVQQLLQTHRSDVFNLGTGCGTSVLEIVNALQAFQPFTVRIEKKRAGEPGILTASADKARQVLQWQPEHSALETILGSAYKWHEKLLRS